MGVRTQVESSARWLGLCGLLLALSAYAVAPKLSTENIQLSADLLSSDLRNDVQVLTGNVRITQGVMSMEAEQATVSGFQSDHSQWTFEKAVHIRTATADLRSDTADAAFASGQISMATVRGTPATFEQLAAAVDKKVSGRANIIEYDFLKGTVRMTQNVWFSYGGNEFRGDVVVYYVNDERVVVNPGGSNTTGNSRVNITIRPGSGITMPGTKPGPKQPTTPETTEKKE
jgi:lipopolysaccharide transport protein LptA